MDEAKCKITLTASAATVEQLAEQLTEMTAELDRLRATVRTALLDARVARDAVNEPTDCFASVIEERLSHLLYEAGEATDGG